MAKVNINHGSLSAPAADWALTQDNAFQRSQSLLAMFNSAMPSFDHAKMLLRHRLCCLPLFIFPSTMPLKQSFERPTSECLSSEI